ncbi:hypothetical protein B0H13DRAFT_1960200 [Mycena leptocephala]|nr:hypothetical protein B0H13DRAFT_1960200 [Mycena leptocephala]
MLAATSLMLVSLVGLATAHFQLQFPPPRGVFVEDAEPSFCDGYDNPASNRTVFPLTGGFYALNSEHTSWTAAVFLSTKANPTTFQDFSDIVPFYQASGAGVFCLNLDLSKTNATGLTDGQNVTLEIVFDGGDGHLYQCADLTLSSTAKIPTSVACKNVSGTADDDGSSSSGTSTATGGSASTTTGAAFPLRVEGGYLAFLLGLMGVAAVIV